MQIPQALSVWWHASKHSIKFRRQQNVGFTVPIISILIEEIVEIIRCRLLKSFTPWWRHQIETVSALLAICAGNSPVPGEFPAQRPVTRSFDVFFDLRLNKRLSKQSWGWWFEMLSRPLWRHSNAAHLAHVAQRNIADVSYRVLNTLLYASVKT